ncbi:hypothetical protein EVAR_21017_1 [Eumeta japonica]|uniref:Uncharacterized protein n=1 Tax=Eumeta variegata TaxID=151549 RepID=A0A4C1UZU1_EUMVA|nr:hypothetical protein EVAR_21017_1 [Eumeta japonica]
MPRIKSQSTSARASPSRTRIESATDANADRLYASCVTARAERPPAPAQADVPFDVPRAVFPYSMFTVKTVSTRNFSQVYRELTLSINKATLCARARRGVCRRQRDGRRQVNGRPRPGPCPPRAPPSPSLCSLTPSR